MNPILAVVGVVGAVALFVVFRPRKVMALSTATEPAVEVKVVSAKKKARPSPDGYARGRTIAPNLEEALRRNTFGPAYHSTMESRDPALEAMIVDFQKEMGIIADGLYGPITAGALMFLVGHAPPPPYFYPKDQRSIIEYRPERA